MSSPTSNEVDDGLEKALGFSAVSPSDKFATFHNSTMLDFLVAYCDRSEWRPCHAVAGEDAC